MLSRHLLQKGNEMKIFIELETGFLEDAYKNDPRLTGPEIPAALGVPISKFRRSLVIAELGEAIRYAERVIMQDLRSGGLYKDGTADHTVKIESGQGLPLGLVMLTSKEWNIVNDND